MKRTMALVTTLALAAVGLAGTGEARTHRGPARSTHAAIRLTYKKWFAPTFPNMVGTVGGDIQAQFGGAVLQVTPPDFSGRFLTIRAVYIVVAPDPAQSFTARVRGVQDNAAGTAVLDGRVIDGRLRGRHVHAEYRVVGCTESPDGTCFAGTITISPRGHS